MTLPSDAHSTSNYAERTIRLVPGVEDVHRMAGVLLAESAPSNARVLVVGAGGGMELKALATAQPRWQFDGVDPSERMLDLARETLGPMNARVQLHHGLIDSAPEGPYDAAACLLTLHFVELDERRRTLREIHRRLRPGAPFVVMHLSFPQVGGKRALWLSRYAAYAAANGVDPEQARNAAETMDQQLPILTPGQDETLLREAGFADVTLFYVGLAFRGWIALA